MSEDTRLIVKCVIVLLLTAAVLVYYARACYCDACPNRYAIWIRGPFQFCRECKNIEDRQVRRFRPRRSIFDRIRRRAA